MPVAIAATAGLKQMSPHAVGAQQAATRFELAAAGNEARYRVREGVSVDDTIKLEYDFSFVPKR